MFSNDLLFIYFKIIQNKTSIYRIYIFITTITSLKNSQPKQSFKHAVVKYYLYYWSMKKKKTKQTYRVLKYTKQMAYKIKRTEEHTK